MIDLLLKQSNESKSAVVIMHKVAVLGAGVIGLTTAVRLQEELGSPVRVTVFTSELSPNTTGDISAGLWSPYLLQNTPDDKIIKWSKGSQDYFLKLWKEGFASEAGLCLQPMMRVTTEDFKMPSWTGIMMGCKELTPEQLEACRKEYNRNFTGGYHFVSFTCEPSKFLPFLQRKFIENGGVLIIKKIENFGQVGGEFDVIVNCTGLYSKVLAGDDRVEAIRGQVSRVIAPWQFHTILDESDDGNYIVSNSECVILGGTHQVGDVDLRVRNSDTEMIMEGCSKFIPGLKKAKLLKHMVGLRPGRDEVRLELEIKEVDGKLMKILHNYGHGGSGVTLSYGCAGDAVCLIRKAMNPNKL